MALNRARSRQIFTSENSASLVESPKDDSSENSVVESSMFDTGMSSLNDYRELPTSAIGGCIKQVHLPVPKPACTGKCTCLCIGLAACPFMQKQACSQASIIQASNELSYRLRAQTGKRTEHVLCLEINVVSADENRRIPTNLEIGRRTFEGVNIWGTYNTTKRKYLMLSNKD